MASKAMGTPKAVIPSGQKATPGNNMGLPDTIGVAQTRRAATASLTQPPIVKPVRPVRSKRGGY